MEQNPQNAPCCRMENVQRARVLEVEGEPVLSLSLQYPGLPEDTAGLRRMARYYRQVAEQWNQRWEGPLYARACAALQAARAASRPFSTWTAALTFQTTLQTDALLSFRLDARENAGSDRSLTVCRGDVWDLPSGTPRSLRSFFPPHCRWRRTVLEQVARQVQLRLETGEAWYLPDWRERIAHCFDPERFYLTQEGPVVFYPLGSIAHRAEGIPVFPLAPPAGDA